MMPPGSKFTMVTCMSWRMSAGSTKRVVDHTPLQSGMTEGATSCSLMTKASGKGMPGTAS